MTLPGYTLGATLYQSRNSTIRRAVRDRDGLAVVVKFLPEEFPEPDKVARFRREYEMTTALGGAGVIATVELARVPNGLALVLEDFGAEALAGAIARGELTLADKLDVAAQLSNALTRVHSRDVIHKDVNPSNVLRSASGTVKLIDFGISTELRREPAAAVSPDHLEGTLRYLSPEQTGRTSRSLDYRSDLYSLGCTLFHLFTGQPPFEAKDPMELVHCHLARRPRPADEVDPSLPGPIARIVEHLLEKDPETRYQSAAAVGRDLEHCRDSLEDFGAIEAFTPGAGDVSDRFSVPQRLYGRGQEKRLLLEAFDRAADGPAELCMVAGYSGIGKSALVHEVHRPIVERRGYFVSGKFDQFQRDIPYASLVQAFSELVRRLLSESDEALEVWRARLLAAVGVNGSVITDVIPEVEHIIGEQQPVGALAPMEARNRFNLVFESFVRAFADTAHPLAVFLDDLQWADGPSLALIRRLAADAETRHILLIGAYRDNEVDAAHPLMLMVGELAEVGVEVSTITLAPLSARHVTRLVADTLHAQATQVSDLVGVCMDKTGGNPFFLNQLLNALYELGTISFDHRDSHWSWDLDAVHAAGISDNVVELMVRKIRSLSDETQGAMRVAACIGATFDLQTLAIVSETSVADTQAALWPGLQAGLLLPAGGDYKYVSHGGGGEAEVDGSARRARFRWLHDRVQQAAYSMIEADRLSAMHACIGRMMLQHLTLAERDDKLFEIVGHLNQARDVLEAGDERRRLVRLNLDAGRRGIASAAYGPAARFIETGLELLGSEPFEEDAALARALHEEAANAYLLVPDFEAMDRHIDAVMARGGDVLQRVSVYEIRILACQARAMVNEGVATALEVLEQLGVTFPADPATADVGAWLGKVAEAIGEREIEALIDVPTNPDPQQVAAIRVLVNITSTAYIGAPALFPLLVLEAVALSARDGDTAATAYAYVTYGIILCGVLDQFEAGAKFGDLGQAVIAKYDSREYAARTRYIPDCFIRHWGEHQRNSWASHPETYKLGLETGDQEFAAWPLMKRTHQGFFMGLPLPERVAEAHTYSAACVQLLQDPSASYLQETLQAMLGLMGETEDPLMISGEVFDEAVLLPRFVEASEAFGICNHYVVKTFLAFLFDAPERVPAYAEALAPWAASMVSLVHVPVFHLYHCMSLLQLVRRGEVEREATLAVVDESLGRLAVWSGNAPENFARRHALLKGERAAVTGDHAAARAALRQAIALAHEHDYLHEQAIANERLGLLWLEDDEPEVAGMYLARARHRYSLWGATAKVEHLDAAHGAVLPRAQVAAAPARGITVTETASTGSTSLDLNAVLKACQAISSEVRLAALQANLLKIVVQNAGAESAVLLFDEQGSLSVALTEGLEGLAPELAALDPFPAAVVQYVARTGEAVLLDDARETTQFSGDPWLEARRPISVLCEAIQHGGRVTGILYLENNLAPGAFTADRVAVLEILSRQVAVALENARLFEHQRKLAESFARFVPSQYLTILGRESILDVRKGDAVERQMAVLFTDIRKFTTISEGMTPEESFAFVNVYLERMGPLIRRHSGFISAYTGDGLMALFPAGAGDAAAAAVDLERALLSLNATRAEAGEVPIRCGTGVHFGSMILGMLGEAERLEGTVVADAVNTASRLEGLTRFFDVAAVVSGEVRDGAPEFSYRRLGHVRVAGRREPVEAFELLDGLPDTERAEREASRVEFELGVARLEAGDADGANGHFTAVLAGTPGDRAAAAHLARALAGAGPLTAGKG